MFARARLPFQQAPVLASPENSLSPMIPTLAHPSLNPFPCYIFPATGGRVPPVQPNSSPSCTLYLPLVYLGRSRRATFSISFISPAYEHQPRMSLVSPTYAKTGGVYPTQKCRRADILDFSPDISHFFTFSSHTWHRRPVAGHWPLSSFIPHSQSCYRAFTHRSPCLVTMDPSQGTNSYTMPTVNTRPTVHFYRCDPPGEIRS
jgi:hypothetical protein